MEDRERVAEVVGDGAAGADGARGADGAHESGTPRPASRSPRTRLGVGAAVVLLLGALVVAVIVSATGQQGATSTVAPAESSPALLRASTAPAAATDAILVHVLGAVAVPGLVSLGPGSRVVDAIAAAGGLADDAELAGINLARPVSDGEQLAVPHVGDPAPVQVQAPSGGSTSSTVNLNTATQSDLETLPRIGPALATRILDWRTANGPFAAPTDLLSVTGIGQKLFDGLKDRVSV